MNIGLSTCGKPINEELFKSYSKNKITHMEISVSDNEYINLDYKSMQLYAQKHKVALWSFHLPFSPFTELDISNKKLKNKTLKYYSELIKKATDIGIDKFVVHPSAEPILTRFRNNRMEYAKESLYKLAEISSEFNSTILVENLPRTCLGRNSDEILELTNVHSNLFVCFDTNHLLEENIEDFIKKINKKIKSTHISDYDRLNERHWLPGEGVVNWSSLYNSLKDVNYYGPWLYEVGFSPSSTINRRRNLNCSDFYNNAIEIFNQQEITVIGEPLSDLHSWNQK